MSYRVLRRRRLGDDAAAQPQAHAALPVPDRCCSPACRSSSCCCSCTSSAARWATGSAAVGRPGRVRRLRHPRHPAAGGGGVAQGTAISVAMDMTEGIIARFRTMAIARVSVLTGHVVGA